MAEPASPLYKIAVHSDSNPGSADRGKALAFPCYDHSQLMYPCQWQDSWESNATGVVFLYFDSCDFSDPGSV